MKRSLAMQKGLPVLGVFRAPLVGSSAPVSSNCEAEVSESAQISSNGQPQMKPRGDLRMHKSILLENLLPDCTALSYVSHGKIMLEGYKIRGGIFCMCCGEVNSSYFLKKLENAQASAPRDD